ncbi:MAG: ATP-binding protein [Anaerolineae bacterium]|nr:ATP-binding protein [Anaerolineae bacterium]
MTESVSSDPKAEPAIYTLALSNSLAELVKLSAWVKMLTGELHLSQEDAFKLELVLTEAVTNIIQHGYDDAIDCAIKIRLKHLIETLHIEVSDSAKPFNPLHQPEVTFPRSLEEASEGGLGIHLIRNYTNECYYQRIEQHNVLTMVLSMTKPEGDPSRI